MLQPIPNLFLHLSNFPCLIDFEFRKQMTYSCTGMAELVNSPHPYSRVVEFYHQYITPSEQLLCGKYLPALRNSRQKSKSNSGHIEMEYYSISLPIQRTLCVLCINQYLTKIVSVFAYQLHQNEVF